MPTYTHTHAHTYSHIIIFPHAYTHSCMQARALHFAASNGHEDVVELLLGAKADPELVLKVSSFDMLCSTASERIVIALSMEFLYSDYYVDRPRVYDVWVHAAVLSS